MKHHNHDNDDVVGVWIIWLIAALMVSLFLTITSAEASSTMHLVDSYIDDGKGVKVCVYSDGRDYTYVERNRASTCPYNHIDY